MKKLALIAFLIPSFIFGQNSLEKSILKELNSYRAKNGLTALAYDSSKSVASRHHSKWMGLSETVSHYETSDVPNFKELNGLEDRMEFFNVNLFSEICDVASIKDFGGNLIKNELVAKAVIDNFATSPPHAESMKSYFGKTAPKGIGIGYFKIKDRVYVTINFWYILMNI